MVVFEASLELVFFRSSKSLGFTVSEWPRPELAGAEPGR